MDDEEETIVINDLLSFLSCKYKTWPFETLLDEVKKFYLQDEIIQAYRTLRESIQDSYELNENVGSSHEALEAIHGCFLNFNKNELPVFVCRNLENVPDLTIVKSEKSNISDQMDLEKMLIENHLAMKDKIAGVVSTVNSLSEELRQFATKVTSLASKNGNANEKSAHSFYGGHKQIKRQRLSLAHLQKLIDEEDKVAQPLQTSSDNEESANYKEALSSEEEELTGTVIDTQKLRANNKFSRGTDNNNKAGFQSNSSEAIEGTKKRNQKKEASNLASQKVLHIKSENDADLMLVKSEAPEDERDFNLSEFLYMEDSNHSIEDTSIEDEPSHSSDTKALSPQKYAQDNSHYIVHHDSDSSDSTLYSCTLCGFSNPNKQILEIHLMSHPGEEAFISKREGYDTSSREVIQCMLCLTEFASRPIMNNHTKWCPAVIKKRQEYQPAEKHACSICGVFFGTLTSLISHRSYHDYVKPFECSVCGYRFYTRENLDQHFQVHLRPRFQCPYCLHGCTSQFKLNKHIHIHTGYRPFECHLCCFQAKNSASLNEHLTGHTDVNKYPCDVCGKFFETRKLLAIHRSEHPSKNTLICPRCGKEFKQLVRLKKHCEEKCSPTQS